MQNVWKGLVIGALTGAAVGLLRDRLSKVADRAEVADQMARDRAPELVEMVRHMAGRAADLPEKGRHGAEVATARDVDLTDFADKAKQAAQRAREAEG